MRTATTEKKQSLLSDAFEVLLKNLGPQKTIQLWQIFVSPKIDYLKIRPKLFAGKSIVSIYKEAKELNKNH